MQKIALACFVFMLLTSFAFTQDATKKGTKPDTSKATSIMGKVSDDGKTLMDKDGKSWTINNPQAIKGHEGHQVTVMAHVETGKNEIHVISLTMDKENTKKDNMKGDVMAN
jgi:hypothetical protein